MLCTAGASDELSTGWTVRAPLPVVSGWDGQVIPSPFRPRSFDPTATELRRAAVLLARTEGWSVGPPPPDAPGSGEEVRLPVSGGGLFGTCLLRVRPRPAGSGPSPDVAVRQSLGTEHVVAAIRDLGVRSVRGRQVDAVVLADPGGGDLERLLSEREGIGGGEAATILLGVAAGIAALHAAGWAGAGLAPAEIVFVGDGCPALDGLDAVTEYSPSGAVSDAERFYERARALCLRVTDGTGMTLLSLVEAGLRRGSWRAVEESVLAVVAPEPIVFGGADGRAASPAVEVAPAVAPAVSVRALPSQVRRRSAGGVAGALVAALVAAMGALDGDVRSTLARRLLAWMRRRPALVVAGLVPIAVAMIVILLLPGGSAESAAAVGTAKRPTSDASAAEGPRPSPATSAARPDQTTGPARSGATSGNSASASGEAVPPSASGSAGARARMSDDPVDAARDLLDARHGCFAARSAQQRCLDSVVDAPSAFAAEEAAALGSAGSRTARDYSGAQLGLVERWNGAALVSVAPDPARTPHSEPASLLLVRGEAGWRLRAVFP